MTDATARRPHLRVDPNLHDSAITIVFPRIRSLDLVDAVQAVAEDFGVENIVVNASGVGAGVSDTLSTRYARSRQRPPRVIGFYPAIENAEEVLEKLLTGEKVPTDG